MSTGGYDPLGGAGGGPAGGEGGTWAACLVCGDRGSGFHYSVYSCEGCKGFFKRTVQNGKEFSCRHGGYCDVVLANRKKCPACRFAKCCRAGMKLEGLCPPRSRLF